MIEQTCIYLDLWVVCDKHTIMMSCNRHHPHSFAGSLPAIVGFKTPYQQVREEEGIVLVCMVRKRNLDRNDTVTVVTLQQGIREEVAIGV